jgi:hypothetical protein
MSSRGRWRLLEEGFKKMKAQQNRAWIAGIGCFVALLVAGCDGLQSLATGGRSDAPDATKDAIRLIMKHYMTPEPGAALPRNILDIERTGMDAPELRATPIEGGSTGSGE